MRFATEADVRGLRPIFWNGVVAGPTEITYEILFPKRAGDRDHRVIRVVAPGNIGLVQDPTRACLDAFRQLPLEELEQLRERATYIDRSAP